MNDISKTIIQKSIKELKFKKIYLEKEISKIDLAISQLEDVIGRKSQISNVRKTQSQKQRKSNTKITDEMVRDVIIDFYKNGIKKTNRFPTDIGYFSNNHMVEHLGLKRYNEKVHDILEKFVEKRILTSKPYKRGKQYKYIQPKGSTIDIKEIPDTEHKKIYNEPVPGINNNSTVARNKDITKIIKSVESQRYSVDRLGNGHIKIFNREGQYIIIGTSGNRDYEPRVLRAKLAKIGIVV